MKVFILLSAIALASAYHECGENQHYESCGTACPLTCDNYDDPPIACVLMCNPGCHCDEGYVKTDDGRCVEPEECPTKYNTNERNCVDKADPGLCDAYMPRWYYDATSKTCRKFVYGGCGGNGNRYETAVDCLKNCAAKEKNCVDKPESGLCDAYMPSWYYDAKTKKCRRFIYGGCGGNGNRYETAEECLEHCAA